MVLAAFLILALALAVVLTTRDQRPPRVVAPPAPAPLPYAAGLSSDDEREVVAAIDETTERGGRLPALLLYHPSPVVVRRALATMSGRDVTPYLLARRLHLARFPSSGPN